AQRSRGHAALRPRRLAIRVRVTALHCVQAVARHCPKLTQSCWTLLLPEVQGCHPKPFSPSLLTVLLFDGSARARDAAAAALGSVIHAAPLVRWISNVSKKPTRGSTSSLSDKIAAIVVEVHKGLVQGMAMHGRRSASFAAGTLKVSIVPCAVCRY
ncbi:MAG: DUF4042 domain-containing protein, partial [Methanosarcinales archaeon]